MSAEYELAIKDAKEARSALSDLLMREDVILVSELKRLEDALAVIGEVIERCKKEMGDK